MDTHVIDLPNSATAPLRTSGGSHAEGYVAEGHTRTSGTTAAPPQDLSGDPSSQSGGSEPAGAPSKAARRRPVLLASAAFVMVAAVGVGFLISPYNTVYPVNTSRLQAQGRQLAAAVSRQASDLVAPLPVVVAPAAKIAATQAPRAAAPTRPAAGAAPTQNEQQAEILSLRSDGRPGEPVARPVGETGLGEPASAPVARPAAPPARATRPAPPKGDGNLVFEPGMAAPPRTQGASAPSLAIEQGTPAAPPTKQVPSPPPSSPTSPLAPALPASEPDVQVAAVQPVLAQVAASPAAQAEPKPVRRAERPVDPVAVVAALQAAPMTPPEQVAVLNEVARLAIVVRDIRAENAALKARVEGTADRFDQAVADFTRRLALAEAHGALNAAMGADAALSVPISPKGPSQLDQAVTLAATGRPPVGGGTRVVAAAAVMPASVTPAAVRYRVTAASPGLAMLALVDRSGGEGAQMQVTTGDQVPGYGRVTAIQQRGSSWIVQTDKGPDKGVIQ